MVAWLHTFNASNTPLRKLPQKRLPPNDDLARHDAHQSLDKRPLMAVSWFGQPIRETTA